MDVFVIKFKNGKLLGKHGEQVKKRELAKEFTSRVEAEAFASQLNEDLDQNDESFGKVELAD